MDWSASSPSSYYPQHPSYPYSTERIADLCLLKLQHASSGRTHSLLRQVQLTCMLHRIRMQAFLRPAMAGYHPHYQQQQQHQQQQHQLRYGQRYEQGHLDLEDDSSSDSDLVSDPSSSPSVVSAPALSSQSTYDWDLDMLLSMSTASPPPSISTSPSPASVSSDSPSSASPTDDPDQTMFALSQHLHQQQHHMSSIPMVSYTSDYASEESSPPSIEALQQSLDQSHTTSIALSSIPSSLTASSDLAQQQQQQQQSYYEMLMAANPNEPLSQLMSTTAATIASSSFTAPPTSISTPPAPPSSLEHSSTYSLLDGSVPRASTAGTADIPRAEDVLTSVATTFVLSNYVTAGPTVTSDALGSIPLTTREIMDALSGQFPIQQPQSSPSMYSSEHTVETSVTSDTVVGAIDNVEQTSDLEEWQGDSDMMSPPAQPYHSQQEDSTETAPVIMDSVHSEQEMGSPMEAKEPDQDQEMDDMGCLSPPLSPTPRSQARRASISPRSKRLSRSTARQQSDHSESIDQLLADSCAAIESMPCTEDPAGIHKRRRLNVEEGSTSPCSSPESSPPSPKTPPPQSEILAPVQGQSLSEDHDHQPQDEDLDHEKRLKSELSEVAQVAQLVEDVVGSLKSMAPATANLMEAEDAGVLSPSLLARYPKRQSTRLLRRSHGSMPSNNCSPQDAEAHLPSTGKVSAA